MSNLLLSEALPLRTTRMLGDFAEDLPLPEVLGDLTAAPFPGIRLSDTRFFAADHPMEITGAEIDRQPTNGWERRLESDGAGRTWTEVVFAAPIPPPSKVAFRGRGKLDDVTGQLIENPADAVRRVCQIAGRNDDWSALRAECSAQNLIVAGRIFDLRAINLQIDQILQSVGAIWAHGMARLYPTTTAPAPILDLDRAEVSDVQVTATLLDTADVLRLSYDVADASGRAQHYIELSASPQRYGGLATEIVYPWLRTPANAESVGRAVLARLAGERYDVQFITTRRSIRPGQWVRLIAHPEWPMPGADPIIMALAVEIDPNSDSVRVVGETIIGQALITVTGHSVALPDTVQAAVEVAVKNGVATFTITDRDGKPLAHAAVSLDGGAPKYTDAQGKVAFAFPAKSGNHTIEVQAVGYLPFSVAIQL